MAQDDAPDARRTMAVAGVGFQYHRLVGLFGFERPGIRGLAKMHLRVTMAVTIMLAMALGRIRAGQPENLRSLVKPA